MTDKLRRLLSVRQIAKRARVIYNKKNMQHNALTFNNVNRWFGLLIVNHFKSLNLISSIWSNGFKCNVSKTVANNTALRSKQQIIYWRSFQHGFFSQRNGYFKNTKKNNNTTHTQIRGKSNYSMKKEKRF